MTKLQEQFEDETGMVAFGRGIDCKIYSDAYVEWLEAKAGQHETIIIGMTGEVVKMGTMFVDDELLTGVFVMFDPDEFTKQKTNILYRNVKIVPFDECE